tara:strand:- start:845 stop:1162 length:318 start_codon:yes stop_codon:yes gene_type:complete
MVNIKKDFNLIAKRLATFVSSREDILSENQFVKLNEIEKSLHQCSVYAEKFSEDAEKYVMNYAQIKREIKKIKDTMLDIRKEVREIQDWSTNTLEKHLNKTITGK